MNFDFKFTDGRNSVKVIMTEYKSQRAGYYAALDQHIQVKAGTEKRMTMLEYWPEAIPRLQYSEPIHHVMDLLSEALLD